MSLVLMFICDPPRENATHSSLKFSFVSRGTGKTKERVHSNKEACQDLENKKASEMTR